MRLIPGAIVASSLLLLSPLLRAADPVRTGLTVAPPKVFDNRALVIMLEQLERQLQSINVVESQKDKLLAALSTFQGARISDMAQALSVTGHSLPKVITKETPGDAGELQYAERNTEQAAATSSAPAAPQLHSELAHSPAVGVQAEDVLFDQVNLTYQIMNVRMLLDRALSDRLHNGNERVQVVLGFQIGIDPPRRHHAGDAAVAQQPDAGRRSARTGPQEPLPEAATTRPCRGTASRLVRTPSARFINAGCTSTSARVSRWREASDKAAFVAITVADTGKKPVSLVSVLPYSSSQRPASIASDVRRCPCPPCFSACASGAGGYGESHSRDQPCVGTI